MPEMNQKLDRFTAAILAEAAAESERTIAALRKRREDAQAAAENDALVMTYNYIHQEVARIKAEGGRTVSKRMLDNTRALYLRRNEIAREVFDAVRERIAAYTETAAYRTRLQDLLREALEALPGTRELRVYLRPADQSHAPALSQIVPDCSITFLEGGFGLGGLIVEAPSLGLRCDSSFDCALEALEGHFAELFGLSLSGVSDNPEAGGGV